MRFLRNIIRRIIALVLLIGPFAAPAEAETATDRMWAAINAQDATSLRVAIDQGADPNEPNAEGRVPLYRALVLQNQMLVDTLLSLGADPNARDHRGDPLLFTAMSVGSTPGTVSLINAKVDANIPDSIGMTPLAFAMTLDQPQITAALIKAGADVNAPSTASDSSTPAAPIFIAIRSGKLALVQQLIAAGADVDALDEKGSTPLHRAVVARPAEYTTALVTNLLRAGADANAMRPKGGAPIHNLMFGADNLEPSAVAQITTLLAQHGADVNLPAAFDGATALDIARTKGNQPAVQLLASMGGACRTSC
ncbi:ankyrin repeat domain-containing protein [Dongia deserti]|uniref:ankyrin repeat domain-containing protein n=1 Tax=Dongia deserti TaxID=2268030 RepID=UPI0013C470C3|nr:ankyrin repeat domain-containing protein [Dongia deserti]